MERDDLPKTEPFVASFRHKAQIVNEEDRMKSVYCLLLILLLAACAPAAPAALEEPTPTPNAAELQDAQYYADEMGVSLEAEEGD